MKTKIIIIAAIATALGATSAMAGGYGHSRGGNTQFAYAGAKNVAIQRSAGFLAVNVTGAAAIAANINKSRCCSTRNFQSAEAVAVNQSYQSSFGIIAVNASGALAAAVNVNSTGGGHNNH